MCFSCAQVLNNRMGFVSRKSDDTSANVDYCVFSREGTVFLRRKQFQIVLYATLSCNIFTFVKQSSFPTNSYFLFFEKEAKFKDFKAPNFFVAQKKETIIFQHFYFQHTRPEFLSLSSNYLCKRYTIDTNKLFACRQCLLTNFMFTTRPALFPASHA